MGKYSPYSEIPIEPGAYERIQEKLKDIPKINKERPCKNCAYYRESMSIKCRLAAGNCDFYHSSYRPISE